MNLAPDGSPRGPLTYVISYTEGNTVSDSWAEKIAAAPPDMLHHGHDVPLNNLWGPTAGLSAWDPDHNSWPGDVLRKIDDLRRGIDRLHGLGVRWVLPYINPSIIGGTYQERDGAFYNAAESEAFFHFWGRKDEFAEFGLDKVPNSDPMDWMQRNWFSFQMYKPDCTFRRYEPCLRRESWLAFVEIVVDLIAQAGYDGAFSDDDLVNCYCPQCTKDFRKFLEAEYGDSLAALENHIPTDRTMLFSDDGRATGPAMRRPTSGELSRGPEINNGVPVDEWETLVWQASQAFWSDTIGDMLSRLRDRGRRRNDAFFIVANWGMSMTAKEFGVRRRLGHDFRRWQPGATWQMLEEGGSCGYVAPGLAVEFWTPCRVLEAHGAEPVLLPYHRSDPGQQMLVGAEIASASCGALAQGSTSDRLTAYRSYFEEYAELFAAAETFASVGVLYSLDEIARNNDEHLRLFYAVTRALGRSHVPFEIVTVESLPTANVDVIVNPGARSVPASRFGDVPVVLVGPGGHKPESVMSRYEIELDRVLDEPREQQEQTLAGWANVDLSGMAPLAGLVRKACRRDPALTTSRAAHAVRLRPYRIEADKRLAVHAVNYGCTTMSDAIATPGRSPKFPMAVPAIDGWNIAAAWTVGPEVARENLDVHRIEDSVNMTVPATDVYRVVELQYA